MDFTKKILFAIYRAENKSLSYSFVVGGFPRELYLKKKFEDIKLNDIDIAVFRGDYRTFAKQLAQILKELFQDSKVVLVDIEKYKMVRVILDRSENNSGKESYEKRIVIDVSAAKGGDVKEDLLRRDFTINTLVIPVKNILEPFSNILDPLGTSVVDITHKVIRAPGSPLKSIKSDPVRIIRAARFVADEYILSHQVTVAIQKCVKMLTSEPRERIGEELRKLFLASKPSLGLLFLRDVGVFHIIYPKIVPALYKEQKSPYHYEGVFEHCCRVADITPADIVMRLSAFFHDIGKAFAEKELPDGRIVYWGHEKISKEIATDFLETFKFPENERKKVAFIVENHMINYSPSWSDTAVRRLIKKLGTNTDLVLSFVEYDIMALKDPYPRLKGIKELRSRIAKEVMKLGRIEIKSPLNGYEIQSIFNLPPGPLVGKIKAEIERAIVEGKIEATKSEAIEFVRKNFESIVGTSS